jgi:predicted methyltransferase MtxX (methanogen marker protein 4)
MQQDYFKTEKKPQKQGVDTGTAKKKLEEVNQSVQASTKKVKLKLVVGCGCGGSYTSIEREVEVNSRLKDGDVVTDRLPGDVDVKEKSKSWI